MCDIEVSVYCLAYNHEKYIRKALEGFVMQKTNFKYEVVIHDDASTDNTAQIIREYEKKYPDIIKPIYQSENQKSKGVSIKNRFMLPKMKGKYIAYCEGDDYWIDENKLQLQYDIMERYSDVYMCTHLVQCVNENSSKKEGLIPDLKYGLRESGIISSEQIAKLLYDLDGYPFHTSSYFLRREVMESKLCNVLSGRINGDSIRVRTAMSLGNIYFINSIMSYRRLWTVGNWNSRMKKLDSEKKIAYIIRNIEGDILFDDSTEHRFRKWILPNVYQRLYLILRDYSAVVNSEIINRYRIQNWYRCFGDLKVLKKVLKYYRWRMKVLFSKKQN